MDTLHEDLRTFMILSRLILVRIRNISNRIFRENQNKHFCSVNVSEDRAICEIMWKNMVEAYRPQMAIRRMRVACWTRKATDTHP